MKRRSWIRPHLLVLVVAGYALIGQAVDIPDPLPDPDGRPADMSKPVQVFILMGQSNMLGFGKKSGGDGSLEHAVKEKGLYPYLVDDSGNWTVRQDVRNVRVMNFKDYLNEWMTISGNIGPEIGIGHYVGYVVDAPVLILKSCIGNRSLGWDLLPPGSEPYESNGQTIPGYRGTPGNPQGNGEKVEGEWYAGKQYDDDTDSAKQVLENLDKYYPGATKYEVAGFCFWQGAKDGGNAAHAERYEQNLVQFIKALRNDFNAPDAPFVVATMGHGVKGSGGNAGIITDAQLAVDGESGKYPEFRGNVATFYSNPVSMGGSANGHYSKHAETYMNVGEGMGKAMAELLTEGSSRVGPRVGSRGPGRPAAAAPSRQARRVSPEKLESLNRMLMETLQELSDAGQLDAGRDMPLSKARVRVSPVSVKGKMALTFRSSSGKTATFLAMDLKLIDFANLALHVTKIRPTSVKALAVTGVYSEALGRVEVADLYYAKAGPEATTLMENYFE